MIEGVGGLEGVGLYLLDLDPKYRILIVRHKKSISRSSMLFSIEKMRTLGHIAGMAELADANDSRSFDRKEMRVQVSLPALQLFAEFRVSR